MYWKEIVSFLLSFVIGTIIIVYLLDVASWMTGNRKIVHSYYYYLPNLFLDLLFVAAYLLVALSIIKYFNIQENVYKFAVVIITTIIITSLWCLYFRSKPVILSLATRPESISSLVEITL